MFVIYDAIARKHARKGDKLIIFNDPNEASAFLNLFYNSYAIPIPMLIQDSDIFAISEAMNHMSNTQILQWVDDGKTPTINFEEIKQNSLKR